MQPPRPLALGVAALVLAACSPAPSAIAPEPEAGAPPADLFETTSDHAISSDGTTDPISLPLGPGHGALVIRVGPGDAPEVPGVCYQLDDVRDADGAVWVPPALTHADWGPYCTTCTQRASVGQGYGLFAFPNNGDPLSGAASVTLRVSLRDCATKLPLRAVDGDALPAAVRVESRRTAPPPAEARGRLDLFFAFAEGTQFTRATAEEDALIAAARAEVSATFDAAAIDVAVTGYADFPPGGDVITYGDADRAPLDALYRAADAARSAARGDPGALLVVFAPCLIEKDPLDGTPSQPDGVTAHLPGGDGLGGHADAVFLKAAGCGPSAGKSYWLDGAMLGRVLAHEIGHSLGLYHSIESNGQADHLDDTGAENLMYFAPLIPSSQGLSPRQIRALRAHPRIAYPR